MENLPKEPVRVRAQANRKVSMALPRQDSGDVQMAAGPKSDCSAAHFADAMTQFGGQAQAARKPANP
jgi:hypothetical protein